MGTAVVTGAGGGLGSAIARRLATDGLRVVACDLPESNVVEVAHQMRGDGLDVSPITVDVTDEHEVARIVEDVAKAFGDPEVLVNAAGVIAVSRFSETSLAQWKRVLDVNLTGAFLMSRALIPGMVATGRGRIVNVASDAAKTAEPWIAAYSASKFGLLGLTQSLALEFAQTGVTINAVCPSISDTAMMTGMANALERAGIEPPVGGWIEAFLSEIPMRRAITPAEVAHACAFFIMPGTETITGEAMNLSGGHEMH